MGTKEDKARKEINIRRGWGVGRKEGKKEIPTGRLDRKQQGLLINQQI